MRRSAGWTLAVLFLAAFLSYTDRYVLNVLVTEIRADLALSDLQLGLIQGTAFAVIYAIVGLPLGWLADRTNRRNLIMTGLAAWCLGTAACGLADGFWGLFLARLAVGLGEACLFPAAFSLVNAHFPPQRRGSAIGVLMMGSTLGAGSAVLLGAGLLAYLQGVATPMLGAPFPAEPWRQVLILLALAGLPLMALLLTLREPQVGAGGDAADPPGVHEIIPALRRLAPVLGPLVLALGLASLADASLSTWTPAFFVRRFGFDAAEISLRLGPVVLAAAAVGSLAGGWLSDRPFRGHVVGGRQRVAAIAASLALPLSFFALAPHPNVALVGYAGCLLLFSVAATAGVAAVQDLAPPRFHGIFAAGQAFIYAMAGLGLGPMAVALLTDKLFVQPRLVGVSLTIVVAGALASAVVAMWIALLINLRRSRASGQ